MAIQNAEVHAICQQQQHRDTEGTEAFGAQDNNIQVEAENQEEKNGVPLLLEMATETSKGMAVQMDIDPMQ